MRILSFRIENFRNLQLAECQEVPDFMVLCGGNGCGKSALLEALMTAKEHAGAYGNFQFDPRAVTANADKSTLSMLLQFSHNEREFVKKTSGAECPETDEIVIEIFSGGRARATKRSPAAGSLLSQYSRARGSPGFFEYVNAERRHQKSILSTWDSRFLSDDHTKSTLAVGFEKFQHTKRYLAGLKMRYLQEIETARKTGGPFPSDPLEEIRGFFDMFFAPMRFKDVVIHETPFQFNISTPLGDVDIDDLSSGEKEILNIFVRFHQLRPEGAVILFDEADAHLHPDLERRFLRILRDLGRGNQIILTTHSPEMMIEAGTESLYTLLKERVAPESNQLTRVTEDEQLHNTLADLMGSRGIISFNQRIIFIEGENASADRGIYEAVYPPRKFNVSFVPVGNSAMTSSVAERVNSLLTASVGFQMYYSIIDGDLERLVPDPTEGRRLFRLPVYHVENFLLDEEQILEAVRALIGPKTPFKSPDEVTAFLKDLVLQEPHLNSYSGSLLNAAIADIANEIRDTVLRGQQDKWLLPERPVFSDIKERARELLENALRDDTWRAKCKGRELLRALCGELSLRYEHLRNLLISKLETPPPPLAEIMDVILSGQ